MTDQATNNEGTPGPEGGEGQGQQQQQHWTDSLPEQLRDAPFFKAANDIDDAVNQIKNASSHMGNSIRIPSEDASPEDKQKYIDKVLEKFPDLMPKPEGDNLDAFYNSLGRPSKPEEYRYEPPEGKEVPEDFAAFQKAAHEAGLTQQQFQKVLGDVLNPVFESQEVAEAEQRAALQKLGEEWGRAYDSNVNALKNFLDLTDAPEGIRDLLENEAMSPEEMKWLHSIATQTGSPTELAKQRNKPDPMLSPNDAKAQIQEIMNNRDHPYWNATHPLHKDSIEKMIKLQGMANPGSTTQFG